MKKTIITAFMIICLIPLFVMLAIPGIDTDYENRPLSRFPRNFDVSFPSGFQDFFSDNFGLRATYISTVSYITSKLFADSLNEKVIIGKNGWLFFDQTIDDYLGKDRLSDLEVKRLARILAVMSSYIRSLGIEFYFMPVPNKNSVYPEYMPKRYSDVRDPDPSLLIRLTKELSNEGIGMIELLTDYINRKEEGLLYHKKDTHWNNKGAYIACTKILDLLDVPYIRIEETNYDIRKDHFGDLQKMLTPAFRILDDQVYINQDNEYSYISNFRTFDDLAIITGAKGSDKTLLMHRDSFANALIPLLSGHFLESYYYRHFPYDYSLLLSHSPDAVIVQIAERSLKTLLESLPVYPSLPLTEEMTGVSVIKADGADISFTEKTGYYEITGISRHTDAVRIYFVDGSEYKEIYYEAMVMRSDETDNIHFRAIIEKQYIKDEQILFSVYYSR